MRRDCAHLDVSTTPRDTSHKFGKNSPFLPLASNTWTKKVVQRVHNRLWKLATFNYTAPISVDAYMALAGLSSADIANCRTAARNATIHFPAGKVGLDADFPPISKLEKGKCPKKPLLHQKGIPRFPSDLLELKKLWNTGRPFLKCACIGCEVNFTWLDHMLWYVIGNLDKLDPHAPSDKIQMLEFQALLRTSWRKSILAQITFLFMRDYMIKIVHLITQNKTIAAEEILQYEDFKDVPFVRKFIASLLPNAEGPLRPACDLGSRFRPSKGKTGISVGDRGGVDVWCYSFYRWTDHFYIALYAEEGVDRECTLLEYLAAGKSVKEELLSITRKVRVPLVGGPTVLVEGPAKEEVQASRMTMEELPANFFSGEEAKKFYVLGSGQLQAVVSGKEMRALVENGSESTVCRESITWELGLEIDRGVSMSMVVADNKLQPAEGVCHSPVIEVAGVETKVPIFSVKERSSELNLGRTWLSAVHATTVDLRDGSQTLSIQSPDGIRVVLRTVDAQDERNRTNIARRKESQSRVCRVRLEEVAFTDKGTKGDQLEVEDVGDRIVINGVGYEKEDEEEQFGGCVRLSFLEESP
ncbi:hypothetical protein CBR_g45525 [Chara braunii]|uniref:Uncharacterized protein n=1 Tax=Chara braunii TaxID=69332 RepID=A0A388LYS2_CHABU|nr:hypothetical protein CBR_g45525 [Chara braunii]|eukprot:GBG87467.1 hypothetical protein CBR_g45525 [Chara braunii]